MYLVMFLFMRAVTIPAVAASLAVAIATKRRLPTRGLPLLQRAGPRAVLDVPYDPVPMLTMVCFMALLLTWKTTLSPRSTSSTTRRGIAMIVRRWLGLNMGRTAACFVLR